jgi:hypothetical protein
MAAASAYRADRQVSHDARLGAVITVCDNRLTDGAVLDEVLNPRCGSGAVRGYIPL